MKIEQGPIWSNMQIWMQSDVVQYGILWCKKNMVQ